MAGLHGKLPLRGDFISRDLSRETRDSVDDWFQQGLEASHDKLGENWLELYSVAPIWHFYVPEGVFSENAYIGIWMPSADRVGRHFPLMLMEPLDTPISRNEEINSYFDWFLECEEILLSVFEDGADFDDFCQRVNKIQAWQKNIKEDDIDDVFELLGSVDGSTNSEESIQEDIKDGPPDSSAPDNPLLPKTPFEKAMLAKLEMLQTLMEKLCQKCGLDYHYEIEELITKMQEVQEKEGKADITDLAEQNQEKQVPAPSFQINRNVTHVDEVWSEQFVAEMSGQLCIWLSEGNEDVPAQLIFTKGLPASEAFYQFIAGFEYAN